MCQEEETKFSIHVGSMFIGVVFGVLFSVAIYAEFAESTQKEIHADQSATKKSTNKVKLDHLEARVIKVKDCEYVFWEHGRGSDFEHYEACNNPAHQNHP